MRFASVICIWCVCIIEQVRCQQDSNLCDNVTSHLKMPDATENLLSCSKFHVQEATLLDPVLLEDRHGWTKCEVSVKLGSCWWPSSFATLLQSLWHLNPEVKVVNFAFSEAANGSRWLNRSMLEGLHELYALDLSGNGVELLEGDVLEDVRRLRQLDLSRNRIGAIPKSLFQNSGHLRRISLASNKIRALPKEVFHSTRKLIFLNLSDNALELIGPNLFVQYMPLQRLYFGHNHIKIVDENAFNKLFNLSYVDLSYNNISFPYSPPCRNGQLSPEFTSNELLVNMALLTKGPTVDLSHNNISGLSVSSVTQACFKRTCNKIRILLDDNPISCECRAYDLIQYFGNRSSQLVYKVIDINQVASCSSPETRLPVAWSAMNSSKIYCNISECDTCPRGCRCGFHKDTVRTVVRCDGLNFTDTPSQLRASSEIELWLRHNQLTSLGPHIPYFYNITVLSVAYNRIRDLFKVEFLKFSSLQVLEMDHNELQYLNISTVSQLKKKNLKKITLGHNPWNCDDCRIEHLVNFLQISKNVDDLADVNCSGTSVPVLSVHVEPCNASWSVNAALMVGAVLVMATVTPLAMYVGYRLRSKLWHRFSRVAVDVEMDAKEFDAFISYSHEDEFYVCQLTRQLEQRPDPFRICLHSRNWLPGELIIKQIVDSVKRSRTTVIVLSTAYIRSEWCTAEFQIALTHMLIRRNHKVIVIWCAEENPLDMELQAQFRTYLRMCTYLRRDDHNFLKRLELAIERL